MEDMDMREEIRLLRELSLVRAAQIAPALKESMAKRIEAVLAAVQAQKASGSVRPLDAPKR